MKAYPVRYEGETKDGAPLVYVFWSDNRRETLADHMLAIGQPSKARWSWGDNSEAAGRLAYCLLAATMGCIVDGEDVLAFRRQCVGRLPLDKWALSLEEVYAWCVWRAAARRLFDPLSYPPHIDQT